MDAKRQAIVALASAGKPNKEIVRALAHLCVTTKLVYRTMKRYKATGSIAKRYGGGPKRTATSMVNIRKVAKRLRRNPRRSANELAKDLGISRRSVGRIMHDHLRVKAYKMHKVHALTPLQKNTRYKRAKNLLRMAARFQLPNIIFSDEKFFMVQQVLSTQNDRVYLRYRLGENQAHLQVPRTQALASVMAWGAVTADGVGPLLFLPQGVKINATVYQNSILKGSLKPWADAHFKGQVYTFQQDSAPSHKARNTQEWLRAHVPRFIASEEWPPYSPDLNPLDFLIWSILEAKVCSSRYTTTDGLKAALMREWKRIPAEVMRASCQLFTRRLADVVKARGGDIE